MEKKITKAQRFEQIKAILVKMGTDTDFNIDVDVDGLVEFVDHELELLAKKSASKKPTKTQIENETLKNAIVEVLGTFENGATVSEVLGASDKFTGMSNQKISAMLKQLVDENRVVKSTDSKKSIFSVVAD